MKLLFKILKAIGFLAFVAIGTIFEMLIDNPNEADEVNRNMSRQADYHMYLVESGLIDD